MLTGRQQEIWEFLVGYVGRRLPADRPGDRRGGWARIAVDRARAPRQPRAGRLPAARPDEAARPGAAPRSARGDGACHRVSATTARRQHRGGRADSCRGDIEDELGVPEPLGRNADFLLRVRGHSMINAGILDGDIVVIRRREDARGRRDRGRAGGDDESANEATVKRFYRDGTGPAAARERRTRRDVPRLRPGPGQGRGGLRGL